MSLPLDLGIFVSLCVLGWLARRAVCPRLASGDDLALVFPLGAGLLTWVMFLASWAGIPLRPLSLAFFLLSAGAALAAIGRPRAAPGTEVRLPRLSWARDQWPALALIAGLTTVVGILAVGTAYSAWDAIAIWGVKGYGIALEGTVMAGARWGAHGLAYPLNIPLMIAVFRLISGDALPGSKLIFAAFYGASLLGALAFWQRRQVPSAHAAAGVALLGLIPLVFVQGVIGYANLPLACYLLLGAVYGGEGLAGGDRRLLALAGMLLGLAAWTRPEGFVLSLAVAAALLLTAQGRAGLAARAGALLAPAAVIAAPWLVFARLYSPRSQIASALADSAAAIASGRWNPDGLIETLRFAAKSSLDPEIWGVLVPAAVVLLVLRRPTLATMLRGPLAAQWVAALALGVSVVGLYYIATFSGPGADWWLTTRFNRMMIPSALLGGLFVVGLSGRGEARNETRG